MSTVRETISAAIAEKFPVVLEQKVGEYFDSVSGDEGGEGNSDSICVTELYSIGRIYITRIPVIHTNVDIRFGDNPDLFLSGVSDLQPRNHAIYMKVSDIPDHVVGMKFTSRLSAYGVYIGSGYSATAPLTLKTSTQQLSLDVFRNSISDDRIIHVSYNGFITKNDITNITFYKYIDGEHVKVDLEEDTRYLVFWADLEGLSVSNTYIIDLYFF